MDPDRTAATEARLLAKATSTLFSVRNQGGTPVGAGEPEDGHIEVPWQGSWSYAEIADLHGRFTNRSGRAAITAVAVASMDGHEATYEDLRAAADSVDPEEFTYNRLRSQLSWFAKYSKAIKGRGFWPMQYTDRGAEYEAAQRHSYLMPKPIAAWWLALESLQDNGASA